MQLAQKIRIFPNPEQLEVLWRLSEVCRWVYNYALSERKTTWENRGDAISYTHQQNTLPALKEEFPWLRVVYSKVLQMVLRQLDQDYKSFIALRKKGRKAKPPRFKGKRYFTTMSYNQSGFRIESGVIKLSHAYNEVPLLFEIPKQFSFDPVKQVDLFQTQNGAFYVSIVYEVQKSPYQDNDQYQAIDLGITNIVTAVNVKGRFLQIKTPRPDQYWQSKIEEVQSKQDHCLEGSYRCHRYNETLLKMQRKLANQLKDYQHKLSRKLVDNTKSNTLILGDLNVKKMVERKQNHTRSRGLRRAMQNTGYLARFAGLLTYKAALVGKKVVKISEAHTSKTCCCCGKIHDMPLHARILSCDCGNVLDRDKNAAVNIMTRFLSQNASVDRLSSFEEMLRHTGLPIGRYSQEAPVFRSE